MRKLKVWGGQAHLKKTTNPNGSNQTRTIVAATTKKRAVELLCSITRFSMAELNNYWCITGNVTELATATEEGVWVNQGAHYEDKFEKVL